MTRDLISKHGQLGLASEVSPVSTVPPGHRERKRLHPKLQAAVAATLSHCDGERDSEIISPSLPLLPEKSTAPPP